MSSSPEKRNLFWSGIKSILSDARSAIVGVVVLALLGLILASIKQDKPISIDFQEVLGCPSGRLSDVARKFKGRVSLDNGADNLLICHNSKLSAVPSNLPRALANAFPACLSYSSGSLSLKRKSDAVCALSGNAGFLCIGIEAAQAGDAQLAKSHTPEKCDSDTLKRFGL